MYCFYRQTPEIRWYTYGSWKNHIIKILVTSLSSFTAFGFDLFFCDLPHNFILTWALVVGGLKIDVLKPVHSRYAWLLMISYKCSYLKTGSTFNRLILWPTNEKSRPLLLHIRYTALTSFGLFLYNFFTNNVVARLFRRYHFPSEVLAHPFMGICVCQQRRWVGSFERTFSDFSTES